VGHVRVLQLRALRRAVLLDAKERSLALTDESTKEPVTLYTEQGQRVLDLAKEEALSFNHHYIGTEHLLLGILREGSAATRLTPQGATLPRVRAELLTVVGRNEPDTRSDAPLTPRSQRILLIPASQQLVFSVAKEYFGSGRNAREIMSAGNGGLSLAAINFGSKKQTSFRIYATHLIHLHIINALE